MADTVFTAGDTVRLLRDLRSLKAQPEGLYNIVRALPGDGAHPLYRIKHEAQAFECVVSASQLKRSERTADDATEKRRKATS